MVRITVRTHGAILRCELGKENDTISKLIEYTQGQIDIMAKVRDRNAPPVIKDIFALTTTGFHIVPLSILDAVIKRLKFSSIEYELEEVEVHEAPDVDFKWKKEFTLRVDQQPVAKFLADTPDARRLMISAAPGA